MVKEGDLLWTPTQEWVANTNVTAFMQWLQSKRGLTFANYDELWRWSVSDLEAFWGALWDYFQIESSVPFDRVLGSRRMPGACVVTLYFDCVNKSANLPIKRYLCSVLIRLSHPATRCSGA